MLLTVLVFSVRIVWLDGGVGIRSADWFPGAGDPREASGWGLLAVTGIVAELKAPFAPNNSLREQEILKRTQIRKMCRLWSNCSRRRISRLNGRRSTAVRVIRISGEDGTLRIA